MIPEQFRLIATSAALVRAIGPAGAIWVGNAISAQEWAEKTHGDDWWHATKAEIEERTGLSDEQQETARRRLRDIGVLEERRGVLQRGASLATIWYRLDLERLAAIVYRETRQSNAGKTGNRTPEKPANDHTSLTTSLLTSEQPPVVPQGTIDVVEIWNKGVEGTNLPKARATPKRSRVIATRLREKGWEEDFRTAIDAIVASPWHRGSNDRGWIASLDFLLQAGKATEIAERARSKPLPRSTPSGPAFRASSDAALLAQLEGRNRNAADCADRNGW